MRTESNGDVFYTVADLRDHFKAATVTLGRFGLWVKHKKKEPT